jgi:hypothetical protein
MKKRMILNLTKLLEVQGYMGEKGKTNYIGNLAVGTSENQPYSFELNE